MCIKNSFNRRELDHKKENQKLRKKAAAAAAKPAACQFNSLNMTE